MLSDSVAQIRERMELFARQDRQVIDGDRHPPVRVGLGYDWKRAILLSERALSGLFKRTTRWQPRTKIVAKLCHACRKKARNSGTDF